MSSDFFSSVSGLSSVSDAIRTTSGNIGSANVVGKKRREVIFSSQVAGAGIKATGGVSAKARVRTSLQGDLKMDGEKTHIAVQGQGMIPVTSTGNTDEVVYTRDGSFYVNTDGELVNNQGYKLLAWRLDGEGRRPGEAGNVNTAASNDAKSLETVDVKGLAGRARATGTIKLGMRLNAAQEKLKGAGQTIDFGKYILSGSNKTIGADDVIIPNVIPSEGVQLAQGDSFSIKIGDKQAVTYSYGGLTYSKPINTLSYALNAQSPEGRFQAVLGGMDMNNYQLRVTVNGAASTLRYIGGAGTPNPSNLEFNTLDTLAKALNNIEGLSAKIQDGVLYIAPKNGSHAVTFANIQGNDGAGGNFDLTGFLGIRNIPAAAVNENRFATLGGLKSLLNNNSDLTVNLTGSKLDVRAASARQGVEYTANALGASPITSATVSIPAAGDEVAFNRALRTLTINQPAHGLKVGDYINVSNLQTLAFFDPSAGPLGLALNGTYYVTNVTNNSFSIAVDSDIRVGAGADQVAAGTSKEVLDSTALNATWRKAFGQVGATISANPNISVPSASTDVTLTIAGHGLADNDVVYISSYGYGGAAGREVVPDGYYRVSGVAGDNFHIQAAVANTTGAPVNAALGRNINITKVGTGAVADPHKIRGTTVLTTTVGSPRVKIHMPNNGLQIGDYFSFSGLGTNATAYGVAFANDKVLKVIDADATSFTFEADANATGTGAALPAEFNDIKINYVGKFLKALGMSDSQRTFKPAYHYSGGDAGSNLASGEITEGVWQQAISIYDSQGISHDFRIAFAKLENNSWVVEIFNAQDGNGNYDVLPLDGNAFGRVAFGTVSFNGDGSIAEIDGGLTNDITIRWTNGAADSQVNIDWGKIVLPGDDADLSFSEGGVKQVKGANSATYIEQDGFAPGEVVSLTIDEEGYVIATFSNEMTMRQYQIPLAFFRNVDALEELSGGVYRATFQAGQYLLKAAGSDNMGNFVAGALEQASIDQTNELTEIMSLEQSYKMLAQVLSKLNNMQEFLISHV